MAANILLAKQKTKKGEKTEKKKKKTCKKVLTRGGGSGIIRKLSRGGGGSLKIEQQDNTICESIKCTHKEETPKFFFEKTRNSNK